MTEFGELWGESLRTIWAKAAVARTSRPSRDREGVARGAIARAMDSTLMAAP